MKRKKLIRELYKIQTGEYPNEITLNKYLGYTIDITNYYEIKLYITRLEILLINAYKISIMEAEEYIPKLLGINPENKLRLFKNMDFNDTWFIEPNEKILNYALHFRIKIMKRKMKLK